MLMEKDTYEDLFIWSFCIPSFNSNLSLRYDFVDWIFNLSFEDHDILQQAIDSAHSVGVIRLLGYILYHEGEDWSSNFVFGTPLSAIS